ncbi:unnamed protein product [Cyclocybe aegerita]|uniref:FAD-binding PCMH-type domain-containing protein n=1 Tax=Cyclocybe aegerita TaxID=1973307 RepID=A0A8S0X6J5_CYCAE|nr:unnamed protein product [Cyclocybe aegerita]
MYSHRRTVALFFLTFSLFGIGEAAPKQCRCLYGQSCWPNQSAFAALSRQISQPLINPVPPASACYPASSPSGDCAAVLTNFQDGLWRADQPGAMQSPAFETYTLRNGTIEGCYSNTTLGLPCLQGNVPPVGVDARTVGDVQAAVVFARKNNLRLVIKNSGHDYLGRSAGRGGFMLWTHHLKERSFNARFIPQGAPRSQRKTYQGELLAHQSSPCLILFIKSSGHLGSGVQWGEAYDYVNQQGRFILGGLSLDGTVGAAGGWILGGGHSTFSSTFGFGVDNVLEFKAVLADGKFVTVNAYQNTDLFWAMRGGGGGTFGVLTSVTYQTHPIFPFAQSALTAAFATPSIAQSVLTEFVKLQPKLADLGWGGFTFITPAGIQINYVAPNIDVAKANATFSPFADFVLNATQGAAQVGYTSFANFPDYFNVVFTGSPPQVGFPTELTARLLSRSMAERNPAKVAQAILAINDTVGAFSVAGGASSKPDPDAMALHPSMRKAVTNVMASVVWPEGSSGAVVQQQIEVLKKKTQILDRITTDSAAYLNEASLYEKDFKKSFFGSHYPKLRSIKAKYDPQSLFVVPRGVASDEWDSELRCRL